jgi:hypothetical protein
MKSPRQAPGQSAKALRLQDARLVDRLENAALVDGARRRVRRGHGPIPMAGTPAAVGEAGALAMPTVAASRFTDAAPPRTRRSATSRLLAAVRAWVTAGQLGPDRDTTVGRHTGVRC